MTLSLQLEIVKRKHDPKGIAHFLEHKLFERENSEDIMAAFTKLGADSNAFTSFTNTSYLFSTSDNVAECLDLLDELVTSFNITEESVETRKGYYSTRTRNVSG